MIFPIFIIGVVTLVQTIILINTSDKLFHAKNDIQLLTIVHDADQIIIQNLKNELAARK